MKMCNLGYFQTQPWLGTDVVVSNGMIMSGINCCLYDIHIVVWEMDVRSF